LVCLLVLLFPNSLKYCRVRSESRCALRLWHVYLVVSIEVAVEVCCCFTVFNSRFLPFIAVCNSGIIHCVRKVWDVGRLSSSLILRPAHIYNRTQRSPTLRLCSAS
jgi:hypothetical protein